MANCVLCNAYFRRSKYNPTDHCEGCLDEAEDWKDAEDEVDINQLLNPTGKTPARFADD